MLVAETINKSLLGLAAAGQQTLRVIVDTRTYYRVAALRIASQAMMLLQVCNQEQDAKFSLSQSTCCTRSHSRPWTKPLGRALTPYISQDRRSLVHSDYAWVQMEPCFTAIVASAISCVMPYRYSASWAGCYCSRAMIAMPAPNQQQQWQTTNDLPRHQ